MPLMSIQEARSRAAGPGCRQESLTVEVTDSGPVTVVKVDGELDMGTVHLLTDRVEEVLDQLPLRLVLDLADVTFFCADGIGALYRIRHAVTGIAADLELRDPSPITRRVLHLTRTAHDFHIQVTSG